MIMREFKGAGTLTKAIQNVWMQGYLVPGKHHLVLVDTPYGKRGKAVFLVDDVRSNIGETGKVVCVCICDILVDPKTGDVVRKPNYRARHAGAKAGRRVAMYEQLFVPLAMVPGVVDAMRSLAGCPEAAKASEKLKEEVVDKKKSEETAKLDEFFRGHMM
jgi:hypothetical protein